MSGGLDWKSHLNYIEQGGAVAAYKSNTTTRRRATHAVWQAQTQDEECGRNDGEFMLSYDITGEIQ